jgi:hypothetical protein
MDRLFSPCTRLDEIFGSQGVEERLRRHHLAFLQELNLDVSTEELLSAERAYTFADLYAMLGNRKTVLWLTPHAAVVCTDITDIHTFFYRFGFTVDGQHISALARSSEALSEIVDVVRRLLLENARDVNELEFREMAQSRDVFFNAPSFAYVVEQCQNLKALTLERIALDEDHCRVLGEISKPGLEIVLDHCKITVAAAAVLAQLIGRNQGPTKLDCCDIDNFVLADGLCGNSRLKVFRALLSGNHDVGNREVLAIADALRENKGLFYLDLVHEITMSDETWDAVCDSLKTHPTLEILNLCPTGWKAPLAPEVVKSRIQTLLDMLKVNMSIHKIELDFYYYDHKLFRGSVIPCLKTNRLRPKFLAIQKTRLIPYLTSCSSYRSQSLLDAFIRECRSCRSVYYREGHAGCEPPHACYGCRYFKYYWCRRYCWST